MTLLEWFAVIGGVSIGVATFLVAIIMMFIQRKPYVPPVRDPKTGEQRFYPPR